MEGESPTLIITLLLQLKLRKKHKINNSHKQFSEYISNETSGTIYLQSTDKEEIANIISSRNYDKAFGPTSIPYRILFFLKN